MKGLRDSDRSVDASKTSAIGRIEDEWGLTKQDTVLKIGQYYNINHKYRGTEVLDEIMRAVRM